ncbi:MAG: hypothetical protein WD971_03535 [Pirellulales bacterium]
MSGRHKAEAMLSSVRVETLGTRGIPAMLGVDSGAGSIGTTICGSNPGLEIVMLVAGAFASSTSRTVGLRLAAGAAGAAGAAVSSSAEVSKNGFVSPLTSAAALLAGCGGGELVPSN